MRSHRFLAGFGILLFLLYGSVSAQTLRRNFNRAQTYDAEHYVIRIGFDRKAKKVIGETSIRFRPLKSNFQIAEFDAVGISFSSVKLEPAGTPLKFRTAGDKIIVTLDKAYRSTDSITLRFAHSASPRKGVYF